MRAGSHSIEEHFGNIRDPRDGNSWHPLLSIISIAILAILCNADGWTEVELFGRSKQKWLETFLYLPHGIPSHDTFGRVFRAIDPDEFRERILELHRAGRSIGSLAREFEPSANTISNWVKQARIDAGELDEGLTTDERAELRRLRRENRRLKLEREILEKAAAWFAREAGSIPKRDSSS